MSIIYDPKLQILTDEVTGVSLRRFPAPDYISVYHYSDPAVKIAVDHLNKLPAGTVRFDAEFIYSHAPMATRDGRLRWGEVVGYHLRTHYVLHKLYCAHLQVEGNPPEVQARVATANTFIRDAIYVLWEAQKSRGLPIVDLDGKFSHDVRCFIPRYGDAD